MPTVWRLQVLHQLYAAVLGGAFGKIVTAMVGGLVMPLVSYVMPEGD